MTTAQQAAWLAYYTCMRDHPDATPEERKIAKDMLAKGARIGIRDFNPEDLV